MIWVYENHQGYGLYTAHHEIPFEELHCEQCSDFDWEVGCWNTLREFLTDYSGDICLDEGSGRYTLRGVLKDVSAAFPDELTYEEAAQIVLDNRTKEDDDET